MKCKGILKKERKYVVFIESRNKKLVLDGGVTSVSLAVGQIGSRNQFFWSLLLYFSFLSINLQYSLVFVSYFVLIKRVTYRTLQVHYI
jgi:hypothetical protein